MEFSSLPQRWRDVDGVEEVGRQLSLAYLAFILKSFEVAGMWEEDYEGSRRDGPLFRAIHTSHIRANFWHMRTKSIRK